MGSLFQKLFFYLVDLAEWAAKTLLNLLIDFLNIVIDAVASVFGSMLSLLPHPTFALSMPSELVGIVNKIAWFIPLGAFASCLAILVLAYAGYFAVRPVLKFFQLT